MFNFFNWNEIPFKKIADEKEEGEAIDIDKVFDADKKRFEDLIRDDISNIRKIYPDFGNLSSFDDRYNYLLRGPLAYYELLHPSVVKARTTRTEAARDRSNLQRMKNEAARAASQAFLNDLAAALSSSIRTTPSGIPFRMNYIAPPFRANLSTPPLGQFLSPEDAVRSGILKKIDRRLDVATDLARQLRKREILASAAYDNLLKRRRGETTITVGEELDNVRTLYEPDVRFSRTYNLDEQRLFKEPGYKLRSNANAILDALQEASRHDMFTDLPLHVPDSDIKPAPTTLKDISGLPGTRNLVNQIAYAYEAMTGTGIYRNSREDVKQNAIERGKAAYKSLSKLVGEHAVKSLLIESLPGIDKKLFDLLSGRS